MIPDSLSSFYHGLELALLPKNILVSFIGCMLGTLIGVLPGIGPMATISILLSFTLSLDPLAALIMLGGIFYGAQYGGSTTSILCNLPGEATSVVTCLDGHAMARNGQAGTALAIAALASLLAGIIATFLIVFFAPPLTKLALHFNAPEYVSLMLLALIATIVFTPGSILAGLTMACIGMLLGTVGADVETGALRFTMKIGELSDGIGMLPIIMGLFGLNEIISNLNGGLDRTIINQKIKNLWPGISEILRAFPAAIRGTTIGSLLGALPGGGLVLAPFASYMAEQKIAKDPSRFGKGAIEGVAGPEAANNAAAQTSFIPLLTLGIPSNPVIALMLGAMIMHGIQPGPEVATKRPDLFWGLIASMIVGNLMLVIINLPLVGIWVKLLKVPYRMLFPAILTFCCIGVYTESNSAVSLFLLSAFTLVGCLMVAVRLPMVPLLLGFILGPLIEENLRRAMVIANGNPMVFLERPGSLVALIISCILLAMTLFSQFNKRRAVLAEV